MARKNSAVKVRTNRSIQVTKTRRNVIRVDRKGNLLSIAPRQY
jgi:hypothetical protein